MIKIEFSDGTTIEFKSLDEAETFRKKNKLTVRRILKK